jgi:glycosyltransferase involved in cell wall biosynthesis
VRVLWLIKGLGPGGAERLLASAAAIHDHDRFELHVAYVIPAKDHLVPVLEAAGTRIHRLGFPGDRPGAWVVRLHRLLRSLHPDVVHLHSPLVAGTARLLMLGLPRRRRPHIVTTEHNAWPTYALPTRVLNGLTWPLDDAHVAVSEEVKESVRPYFGEPRTEVVVHGIDLSAVGAARADREQMRRELGVADDEVLIGTVANYREQKGYPELLEAARLVLDAVPAARFATVGQGPLEAQIVDLHRRLRLGDRFQLLGYREDPERVLAACDVFVLASRYEGYPVALMEALCLGLPVVATAVGGVPQAVTPGESGLLVPPRRPRDLADALITVAGDESLRARLGTAAAAAGTRFDIAVAVRRVEQIYEELTASGR